MSTRVHRWSVRPLVGGHLGYDRSAGIFLLDSFVRFTSLTPSCLHRGTAADRELRRFERGLLYTVCPSFPLSTSLSLPLHSSPFRGERGLLGGLSGVVNSLYLCPASLKSLGCFYFRCVLSSQWKAVTANFRILHCQLTIKAFSFGGP